VKLSNRALERMPTVTNAPRPINPRSQALAQWLLRLIFDGYLTTHVSERELLPLPGVPTIIASNHTSALDVFAAGHALGRPSYFVAKIELVQTPIIGPFLASVGAIPARRDERDTDVLRQLLAVLKSGGMIGLAPEGTRSPDGRMAPYDPGFVWLAVRTGSLVVPIAIHGTYHLMPKGARFPRRGEIWLRFGEPMSFLGEGARPKRSRLEELAEVVRRRTLSLLAELAEESGVPNPAVERKW